MNPTLHKAANGHLSLDFNELSDTRWLSIAEELVKHHGFKRVGSPVIGVSEKFTRVSSVQRSTLRPVGTIGLDNTCFRTLWQVIAVCKSSSARLSWERRRKSSVPWVEIVYLRIFEGLSRVVGFERQNTHPRAGRGDRQKSA